MELARCCVYGGYDAVIAASSPQIHDVALGLRASGAMVEAVQADLATQAGVDALYDSLEGRQVNALLVIDTNVSATPYLLDKVGSDMRTAGSGRILIRGSIAGFVPGTFGSGVSVTCLMPGATESDFFDVVAGWGDKLRQAG